MLMLMMDQHQVPLVVVVVVQVDSGNCRNFVGCVYPAGTAIAIAIALVHSIPVAFQQVDYNTAAVDPVDFVVVVIVEVSHNYCYCY